jgi:phenylalanyl-tRNA synthetase alpha chain
MPTDEILVKSALLGDKDAFGKLVEKYSSAVYGMAYHIVGNFADAQDLAQEAFITAYLKLHQLEDHAKFAGWLRAITVNICKMGLRKRKEEISSLEEIDERKISNVQPSPEDNLIAKEERDMVMKAVASLPEESRLAVTLYYMDGMTYEEIANFLGVTRSAIDSRLQRARKRLKREMLKMTERTFKEHKLPENFTDKVIAELLAKPKPLESPEHPLRKVWEEAKASLPDYTVVEPGPEIESIKDNYSTMGDLLDKDKEVFHVDSERMLRVHTTTTLVNQLRKYKPPIKLLTAGRVFRRCEETATHYPVFHQIEGLCVGEDVTEDNLKETIRKLVRGVLGDVEIRFRPYNFSFTDPGWEADVKMKGDWREILGMGMFHKRILQEAGLDPETVTGFGFGMGIERLAMIKYGIDDIRAFWRE